MCVDTHIHIRSDFNNVIKPTVIQDGNKMTVETTYASPERWKSIQADGFHRDGNGKIIVQLNVINNQKRLQRKRMLKYIDISIMIDMEGFEMINNGLEYMVINMSQLVGLLFIGNIIIYAHHVALSVYILIKKTIINQMQQH